MKFIFEFIFLEKKDLWFVYYIVYFFVLGVFGIDGIVVGDFWICFYVFLCVSKILLV